MGNFWKYNDKVGAGVSGLATANGGDAIADNEIIRGDGTTGIQGSAVTIADTTGTMTFPSGADITTAGGSTIEFDFGGAGRISLGGTDRELYLDGTNNYIAIRSDTQFGWNTNIGGAANQVGLDGSTSGVLKVTDGGTNLGDVQLRDITGPTTGSDTTAVGIAYPAQPLGDSVQILSSDAGDVAVDITIIGTTTGTDTVVVEVLATDATDGTTPVTSVKADWGQILAVKKAVTTGTITIQKTTGPATVTTLLAAATSSGVSAASNTANAWNRTLSLVSDGATTKQVGIKGTNSSGTTIYDSQALTGTTAVYSNSSFVEVHEFYIGDLEGTRTLTASTQGGTKVDGSFVIGGSTGSTDNAILRADGTGGKTAQSSGVTISDVSGTAVNILFGQDSVVGQTSTYGIKFGANGYISDVINNVVTVATATGQDRHGKDVVVCWTNGTGAEQSNTIDTGLARSAAGVVKVTDGSTGYGKLLVADGTKSVPALAFGSDQDTGIFTRAGGYMMFAANGAEKMWFSGSTTDPINLTSGLTLTVNAETTSGTVGIRRDADKILRVTDGGSLLGWVYQDGKKALTSDFTNATATMADLTGLTTTLVAGRKYTFRMVLFVSNSTAGEGVAIDFGGGTATATDFRCHARIFDTALLLSTQTTALATDIAQATITGASMIEVDGSFTVNAAGTFIPRASENTSATGTLTVETGSYLWVTDTSFS